MRLGVKILTPHGFVRNGEIERQDHRQYLTKEMGYCLERCNGVPEPQPSDDEIKQMIEADRMLGIHRGESGKTRLETDIKKGMRELTAPLRKKTYRTLFGR